MRKGIGGKEENFLFVYFCSVCFLTSACIIKMTNKEMANTKKIFSTESAHRPPARHVRHLFLLPFILYPPSFAFLPVKWDNLTSLLGDSKQRKQGRQDTTGTEVKK